MYPSGPRTDTRGLRSGRASPNQWSRLARQFRRGGLAVHDTLELGGRREARHLRGCDLQRLTCARVARGASLACGLAELAKARVRHIVTAIDGGLHHIPEG